MGQAQGQVLRTLQIRSSQSSRNTPNEEDRQAFHTIEELFFEHMHIYSVPGVVALEVVGI